MTNDQAPMTNGFGASLLLKLLLVLSWRGQGQVHVGHVPHEVVDAVFDCGL